MERTPFSLRWGGGGARGDGRCGPQTSLGPRDGWGRGGQTLGWVRPMDILSGAGKRKETKPRLHMKGFGSKMVSKIKGENEKSERHVELEGETGTSILSAQGTSVLPCWVKRDFFLQVPTWGY